MMTLVGKAAPPGSTIAATVGADALTRTIDELSLAI
jgi:hypothetical protein